jgi:hypothetical protein
MSQVKISVWQLLTLGDWLNSTGISTDQMVTIKVESTGIGPAVTASAETDKGEGIWKDLTEYDHW